MKGVQPPQKSDNDIAFLIKVAIEAFLIFGGIAMFLLLSGIIAR